MNKRLNSLGIAPLVRERRDGLQRPLPDQERQNRPMRAFLAAGPSRRCSGRPM